MAHGMPHNTRESEFDMHAETDRATYWQTVSRLTGHSVRYLRVRATVRAAWMLAILPIAYLISTTR